MRRFKAIVFLLIVFPAVAHALVFDLIKESVDTVSDSAEKIADRLWKQSMLAQTVQSVGHLKKNYDESMSFYNEMVTISKNPNSLLDFTARRFEERGNDILHRQYSNIEREYINAQDDPGVLGKFQAKSTKYIQDNLDFSEKVLQLNKKREEQFYKDTVSAAKADNRDTVEKAKLEAQLATLETLISIEKVNARSLQTLTALYDYMKKGERESFERERAFQKQINDMAKQMRDAQRKQRNTSIEALNEILK